MSIARTWVVLLVVTGVPGDPRRDRLVRDGRRAGAVDGDARPVARGARPAAGERRPRRASARAARASSALSRSAADHSRAMATLGFFAHESPNGTSFSQRIQRTTAPLDAWSVGENLAMFGGLDSDRGVGRRRVDGIARATARTCSARASARPASRSCSTPPQAASSAASRPGSSRSTSADADAHARAARWPTVTTTRSQRPGRTSLPRRMG